MLQIICYIRVLIALHYKLKSYSLIMHTTNKQCQTHDVLNNQVIIYTHIMVLYRVAEMHTIYRNIAVAFAITVWYE